MAGALFGWLSSAFAGVEVVAVAAAVLVNDAYSPIVDRWAQGARGEEHVGAISDALATDGWLAVHDGATGRGNIDHVVVGPGGVFTVETKSTAGASRSTTSTRGC